MTARPMGERRWPTDPQAKWERVLTLIDATGDCWEWIGYRDVHGYGGLYIQRKQYKAHRYVYTELVGPIPDSLELDHLCRNKACVNPDHLEPVTHRVNMFRGFGMSARHVRRTQCAYGHPLDGMRGRGDRYCLTCNRDRVRRFHQRQKEAA